MAAATDRVDLHASVEYRLSKIGLRYTRGRRAVIETVAAAGRPLSINDIADANPKLPQSSAYRNLVDLQKAGVIRRISAGDQYSRYELDEPLLAHHHHLICTSCGLVLDVSPSTAFERSIRHQLDLVSSAHDFESERHILDAFGTCAKCRQP